MTHSIVDLRSACTAAAASGDTVWVAAADRLCAFDAAGTLRLDLPLSGVRSLGASGSRLAAILDDEMIVWLDPSNGREQGRWPVSRTAVLVSGGGAIWAVDEARGEGLHLGEPGQFIARLPMPGIERAAADGDHLWWMSQTDTVLRDGTRQVDVGVMPGERGGLTVCANAAWLSVSGGFVHVGTWGAKMGPLVAASTGVLPFLTCGSGILVGGSSTDGLVLLDPSVDADVRHLDIDIGDDIGMLVAARSMAWVFPVKRPEAFLVPIRVV